MVKASAWQVVIVLAVTGGVMRGQDVPDPREQRQDLLGGNLDQIRFAVALDRSTPYFPGEAATVMVTLTNPTSTPLEILDPRAPGMASFAYSTQGGSRAKNKSEWSSFDPPKPQLSDLDPTTVIQPAQSITMMFPPDPCVRPYPTFRMVPIHPGNYRLRFRLGGEVEFQVGAPFIETSTIIPLQGFKTYREDGMDQPETLQYAAMIVAVRLNDEHLLFAAQHNVLTTHKVEAQKDGTFNARGGEPWVRLLTVPSKVTKLSGTADATGQITLEYTTEDGRGGKLYLDKNRRPL